MLARRIPLTIIVNGHATWNDTYTYSHGQQTSWSWYARNDAWPHLTVSTNVWEADANGNWVGFHLSVPSTIRRGMNMRFTYSISAANVVAFSNFSTTGLPAQVAQEIRNYTADNAQMAALLSLAQILVAYAIANPMA
ncbi:hypothetical protein FNU76_22515 [Chitinimonas arctica]|uniref:Uncharacterized protein n=1 Tax=Chitinimonas arctica TaxID=2594795 RepID=A0A516SL62_9NEIS|nr:hypothetical protein [Chitinimonas arctica]QDQ28901.1 hypothetical protein FNU76_22515 [Chitinimonas arctica]